MEYECENPTGENFSHQTTIGLNIVLPAAVIFETFSVVIVGLSTPGFHLLYCPMKFGTISLAIPLIIVKMTRKEENNDLILGYKYILHN